MINCRTSLCVQYTLYLYLKEYMYQINVYLSRHRICKGYAFVSYDINGCYILNKTVLIRYPYTVEIGQNFQVKGSKLAQSIFSGDAINRQIRIDYAPRSFKISQTCTITSTLCRVHFCYHLGCFLSCCDSNFDEFSLSE